MKRVKLSRAGWVILSGGVFIVILAGLGVTRSQQLQEQNVVKDELALAQTRLEKNDVTSLRGQSEALKQQVQQEQAQLDEAKDRLRQTVISVDVTDELFKIAGYSGVAILRMSNSTISTQELRGIDLAMTSLSLQASGDIDKIIDFVINLNNDFATGYVKSAQISIGSDTDSGGGSEEPDGEGGAGGETGGVSGDEAAVTVQMIVYSYEGD
jgi:hypothetical protein